MFGNTYLYTNEASTVVAQEHNNRRIMNPTHFQLNDESFNQRRTVSEVGNPGGILSTVRRVDYVFRNDRGQLPESASQNINNNIPNIHDFRHIELTDEQRELRLLYGNQQRLGTSHLRL
jgi:hypothetical protein